MRGKIALPLTRSGDELSTAGVPGGSVLEPGGARLARRDAGRKCGREDERRAAACRRAGVGGRGYCRGRCRAGPRVGPERSPCLCCHPVPPPGDDAEAVRRRRLEAGERRARRELSSGHGGRRPDPVAVVHADFEDDPSGVGHLPLHDGGEGIRVDGDDVRGERASGVRAARRKRAERAQRKQR